MMADWKTLGKEMAEKIGLDPRVLYSTVEAETSGRNVTGDAGRALGYGQVWVKWHYNELVQACKILGIPAPSKPAVSSVAGEAEVSKLVLGNSRLSMLWTALVVKKVWGNSGQNFDRFVHGYVGPAVPDKELTRRAGIWKKYWGVAPSNSAAGSAPAVNQNTVKTAVDGGVISIPGNVQAVVVYGGLAAIVLAMLAKQGVREA